MPPLLAALFMIEFSCDLRIVQAIDLAAEWRQYEAWERHDDWYAGWLGMIPVSPRQLYRGTYSWPWPYNPRYKKQ
jgi:hypothetical protein